MKTILVCSNEICRFCRFENCNRYLNSCILDAVFIQVHSTTQFGVDCCFLLFHKFK